MSLRWRLASILGASVALAVGLASFAAYAFADREFRNEVDALLVSRTQLVLQNPRDAMRSMGGGRPRFGGGDFPVPIAEFDAVIQLVDPSGAAIPVFTDAPELPVQQIDANLATSGGRSVIRTVEVAGAPYRMLTTPLPGGGALQIASDVSDNQAALGGLRNRLLLVGLGGVLAAGLLGWLVARRTVGPVERLTLAAEHVAETQDLTTPIEVRRTDEVGRLAVAFNTMLEALDQSRRQQQRLVMDAGHELRTPLTSLRTNIELLQRADDLNPADRRRLIADVDLEIRELSDLVAELVDLAGDRRPEEPVTALRLDEVVESVVETARRRNGRDIVVSAGPVAVHGRRVMLERAIGNLIDNAHKWSPPGSTIEVAVNGGRVEVRDHGPGVSEADRPLIFERFYRAPSARSMPGSGLGLAIVKQIVDTHGGRVFADDAPGGGAVIGFEIPIDETARITVSG